MKCEICGGDRRIMVSLPIRKKDGCLNTIACLECAKNSGVYCLKHKIPHIMFDDGSTACLLCRREARQVKEEMEKVRTQAQERGHELGEWLWDGRSWYAYCSKCGAISWVIPNASGLVSYVGGTLKKE